VKIAQSSDWSETSEFKSHLVERSSKLDDKSEL